MKIRLGNQAKNIIVSGLNLKLDKSDKALCPFHKEKTALDMKKIKAKRRGLKRFETEEIEN